MGFFAFHALKKKKFKMMEKSPLEHHCNNGCKQDLLTHGQNKWSKVGGSTTGWRVEWRGRWEEGLRGKGHGCTDGWFLLMYDRKPESSVKQLSFNSKIKKKKVGGYLHGFKVLPPKTEKISHFTVEKSWPTWPWPSDQGYIISNKTLTSLTPWYDTLRSHDFCRILAKNV